jgi:hypothetical protein
MMDGIARVDQRLGGESGNVDDYFVETWISSDREKRNPSPLGLNHLDEV